jgi:hypothetical protein
MKSEPSSFPKKIIIEEEIVNDNEAPRFLYPSSNARQTTQKTMSHALPTTHHQTTRPPLQNQPPLPQHMTPQGKEEEEEEGAEYRYNLIIDDGGTRWMPIAERRHTESLQITSEKYQLKQTAERNKMTDKAGRGGGGGVSQQGQYVGETQENILKMLGRESETSPQIFIVNESPSQPFRSKTLVTPKDESVVSDLPQPRWGREADAAQKTLWIEQYREVPLRRGDVMSGHGKEEGWGSDRYVAPYISRVKIHGPVEEKPADVSASSQEDKEEVEEVVEIKQQPEPTPSAPSFNSQEQLIDLLSLLVSTQQQTLQVQTTRLSVLSLSHAHS